MFLNLLVYCMIFIYPLVLRRIHALSIPESCIAVFYVDALYCKRGYTYPQPAETPFPICIWFDLVRYSSSRFMEEKNDSITELSYGTYGREKE